MGRRTNSAPGLSLEEITSAPYKYGFVTKVETETFPKGISIKICKEISNKKREPLFLENFRWRGYFLWKKMKTPRWAYFKMPSIRYQNIQCYSVPKTKKN